MGETLFFILVCYGISNIIVFGSLFDGMRKFLDKVNPNGFGALFGCMMCTSFWVGGLVSLIYSPSVEILLAEDIRLANMCGFNLNFVVIGFFGTFLDACFTSGTVWIVHNFEEMLERAYRQ